MPTETGTIDLKAQKAGHDDAATTATNYITEVTGGGIQVHDANDSSDYVQITADGMDVYNDGDNVASFGADGAQIGKSSAAHSVIDADGQRFYGSNGTEQLANIGYGEGASEQGTTDIAPYYTFGRRLTCIAYSSARTYAAGDLCVYDGRHYCCTERGTTGSWDSSKWKMLASTNTRGNISTAEGVSSSRGHCSHSEGNRTVADAESAHAEGQGTRALGSGSHAEGYNTESSGSYSHSEGYRSIASGYSSHAQNTCTIASGGNQTAMGKYNVEDTSNDYAIIIGNGTADDARSNAAVITWLGEYIAKGWAGVIQMFGGSTPPAGWLLCDGSAVSRTTYATLFAAIGTTWGAGDGSTTFNLPDLRGRAPIGAGTGSGLSARTLGQVLGVQDAVVPYHRHTMGAHTRPFSPCGRGLVRSGASSVTSSTSPRRRSLNIVNGNQGRMS